MKKAYYLLLFFTLLPHQIFTQSLPDLLYNLEQEKGEKKLKTLFKIGKIYQKKEPQKAVFYFQKALAEAKKNNHNDLLISTYYKLIESIKEQYNYSITYHAKKGELISDICKRFGITRKDLERHNYISSGKNIVDYKHESFEITSELSFIQPIAYKQVCSYYSKLLKLRKLQNDKDYLIFTLKEIGDFYNKESKLEEAEKHYLEWLRIRREEKDKTKLTWVLRYLADFYRENEQFEKAKKFYDEIIQIDKIRKNKDGFASTLAEISLIYPDGLQAEQYFHQALRIWIEQKNHHKIGWMRDRELYYNFGRYIPEKEDKEAYLLESLKMNKTSMDTVLVYRSYKRLVYHYLEDEYGSYNTREYLDTLWNFAKTRNFTDLLTYKDNLIDRLGNHVKYYAEDTYRKDVPLDYLYIIKDYYEKTDPKNYYLSEIYEHLDYYYRKIQQYDSSAFFLKKRLKIDENTRNIENLDDLAFLYQKAGSYNQALYYFNKALKLQEATQNSILIAEQLNKIGYLYEQKIEPKRMSFYYKKALKNLNTLDVQKTRDVKGNSVKLVSQFNRIASLYEKQGKINKAIPFVKKNIAIFTILYGGRHRYTYEHKDYLRKLKSK